jgi:flagellar biosynthesis protein FlhF
MRVKRYLVDSMPEALKKIKVDLGKNAVILNTKEVSIGGFLGFFGSKRIEVIAAIDETTQAATILPPKAVSPPFDADKERNEAKITLKSHSHEAKRETIQQQSTGTNPSSWQNVSSSVAVMSEKDEDREILMQELSEMKRFMQKLLIQKEQLNSLPQPLQSVAQKLLDQDVNEEIVSAMVLSIMNQIEDISSLSEDEVLKQTKNYIANLFKGSGEKKTLEEKKLIRFVGPTGVGKTTTIAKIAADYLLKQKKTVGLITSDTYRIAAIEQLRTYANILNIPLEVVSSPGDIKKALETLTSYDVVLMDTAGRNYRNDLYVSELNSLLKQQNNSETILVLSLTSKYSDMLTIAEQFKKVKMDKVLFTKADETQSYGAIVNLANQYSFELSFLTYGQNVPEDIATIDPDHVAALILGEKRYA